MPDQSTAQPGQALASTPPPPQQAPVTTPPAPQPVVINEPTPAPAAPAPPAAQQPPPQQTQPTVEQLQQQLQQREAQYQHAVESARYHQSQASRFQNALGQVTTGAVPMQQQDPLAGYAPQIAALKARGYDEQAARDTVGLFADMVKPLQQEVQQTRAAAMASQSVEPVMQQLYAQRPDLFPNQAVYEQTRQGLIAQASAGGQVDMIQAAMTASALATQAQMTQQFQPQFQQQPWPQYPPQNPPQQWQQQPQPIPQPFANGQFHVRPNFQPPAPNPSAVLSPELLAAQAEIAARYPQPQKP